MEFSDAKSKVLDGVVLEYINSLPDGTSKALLSYNLPLQQAWRTILKPMLISPTWRTLDVGSGHGLFALELAGQLPIKIKGVDIDEGYVAAANELKARLERVNFFPPGSEVSFEVGDVNELQFKDSSFDFIMMREIFQYLSEPNKAVSELYRVSSKGAYLFAEDMDDGLYITWPPPHPSMQKLHDAIGELQKSFDGDRNSGRKMSSYIRKAGFSINSASLISEAHHLDSNQVNYERGSIIMQLKAAKSRLLEVGAITEDEFDLALDDYQRADLGEQFRMAARVLLIAQK